MVLVVVEVTKKLEVLNMLLIFSHSTGQQNLTFFGPQTSVGELSSIFMLNSEMYTEFFYQAEFQRYRGLYLCKTVLYVLRKQAETYL